MSQPFLNRPKLLSLLAVLLGLLITACSGVHSAVTLPPTATLTAAPSTITAGQSTTLTWATTNATTVSIDNGVGTNLPATGSATVKPAQTTTYTITATTSAGGSVTAQVTVTVSGPPPPPPPTVTITANPTTIVSGQSTALTVVATNATQVVISNNVDTTTFTLPGTGGTQQASPTQNITYTATATGNGQTATATVAITVTPAPTPPTVNITANPATITAGQNSVLTVMATNATQVIISNNIDNTTFTLSPTGGTQSVAPRKNTIYTATATGNGQTATATATVTVNPATLQNIQHVILLLQENRTFDTYFGMLNPYRTANQFNVGDDGVTYNVDGIDDKLATISNQDDEGDPPFMLFHTTTSCMDDMTSAWLESYGDVNRFNFLATRPIKMDGFVHIAEGFAKSCVASGTCSGTFTDLVGRRAMAYYQDKDATGANPELNFYYYMASQFALSDRWFSPVASKSTPNRIATYTGGTTEGAVRDPFRDDDFILSNGNHTIQTLAAKTIFEELDGAKVPVSWKIYYSETKDGCPADGSPCTPMNPDKRPSTTFSLFSYAGKYLQTITPMNPTCTGNPNLVLDPTGKFCIDPTKIAPITQYYTDVANNALPSFSYIEAEFGLTDEHPGSGQSVLSGQQQAAQLTTALMASPSWSSSAFFLAYDEGGGPYDHVPPVPGHSNDLTTDPNKTTLYPDIASIAVNADGFKPCQPPASTDPARLNMWTPTQNNAGQRGAEFFCDLKPDLAGNPMGTNMEPGVNPADAAAINGFSAQLGFRVPNIIISPYARKHYVGHAPMDHTAVLQLVENRFLPNSGHLTPRVAAQPDLSNFFDFVNVPWAVPPSNLPTPPPVGSTCHPDVLQ